MVFFFGVSFWVFWSFGGIWVNFFFYLKVNYFIFRKGDVGFFVVVFLIYEVSGFRGVRRVVLFYVVFYMYNLFYDLFKKATEIVIFCFRLVYVGSS